MPHKPDSNNIPKRLLEKYPQLISINAAIRAHSSGEEITARCYKCDEILEVTYIEPTGSLWVTCPNGCTQFHAQGRKGKSDEQNSSEG